MDRFDIDPRPPKRPRFFAPSLTGHDRPEELPPPPSRLAQSNGVSAAGSSPDPFYEQFVSIVGVPFPRESVGRIRRAAGDSLERAVNVYFDGSWQNIAKDLAPKNHKTEKKQKELVPTKQEAETPKPQKTQAAAQHVDVKKRRYVGAFGVAAWATTSGLGLITHGEPANIERAKIQPLMKRRRGGRLTPSAQKSDVLTRFTNSRGQEIGRLPQDMAAWVSTLVDQRICAFEGVCVYAPERVRINDTIYLQLRVFMLDEAFRRPDPHVEDTSGRLFEEQETAAEKDLRLRQVALTQLFDAVGMLPTSMSEAAARQKKEGLLHATEKGEPRPSEGDEEPEGEKLEQGQLDALYSKVQAFDWHMPEADPPATFALGLRKYQRQALHWMLNKERNTRPRNNSMHPLWEEYEWPTKDVDDRPLPSVPGEDKFYVNPYSGELSTKFPVQEQNCPGGILADEMGLGKTIEMLSLIHSNLSTDETPNDGSQDGVRSSPKATLIVAPTSLLSQWENEAIKASVPGAMKVLVYYGTDKVLDLHNYLYENRATPTVVVTSYGVVLSEYTQICQSGRSGLFAVRFLRVVVDEAHYIKNRASKTARACCELQAVHRWTLTGTPIVNRLEDLFSLVRFLNVEPWSNFSYWKTFITVPFESKDVLRALNVVQTVLEPLVIRRTKAMKTPDGEALVPLPTRTIDIESVELSETERNIYDLIFMHAQRTFAENVAAGTLLKSYTTIFAQLLRLRQTCCHPILARNRDIVADEEEAALSTNASAEFRDDMDLQELIDGFAAGEAGDPTARFSTHALRQIQTESAGECPICSEEPMIDPAVTPCWHSACRGCMERFVEFQTDRGEVPRCFACRERVSPRDVFEVVRHGQSADQGLQPLSHEPPESCQGAPEADPSPLSSQSQQQQQQPRITLRRIHPLSPTAKPSAKISALLAHLTAMPVDTRAVVFSQFTTFLDLISAQLDRERIPHVRLDGTMPQKARAAVLAAFGAEDGVETDARIDEEGGQKMGRAPATDGPTPTSQTTTPPSQSCPHQQPRVLLISLRAGGVGLNLTAASRVFMMDPWWSFAAEAQAIDRVHRLGQTRPVGVTRFVVRGSIEERMLRVQERKMRIAGSLGLKVGGYGESEEGGRGKGDEERRRERVEELKLLFE